MPRSANIVLLGAAVVRTSVRRSRRGATSSRGRVPPKTVEANLRAFELGLDACAEGACEL